MSRQTDASAFICSEISSRERETRDLSVLSSFLTVSLRSQTRSFFSRASPFAFLTVLSFSGTFEATAFLNVSYEFPDRTETSSDTRDMSEETASRYGAICGSVSMMLFSFSQSSEMRLSIISAKEARAFPCLEPKKSPSASDRSSPACVSSSSIPPGREERADSSFSSCSAIMISPFAIPNVSQRDLKEGSFESRYSTDSRAVSSRMSLSSSPSAILNEEGSPDAWKLSLTSLE